MKPPQAVSQAAYYAAIAARIAKGQCGAQATVIERSGSTPSTPGQKLYVGADGVSFGTVGGGAVERTTLLRLEKIAKAPHGAPFEITKQKLGPELGMCCGGQVTLLLEPVLGAMPVLVVGGGHIGRALVPLLRALDFSVTWIDDREEFSSAEGDATLPEQAEVADVLPGLPREVSVLVMTHDHALDQTVIEAALRHGARFVGGVGSRAKAERTKSRLAHKEFPEADLARVVMPLGVSVGARSPCEIAVAIAAAMIAERAKETP